MLPATLHELLEPLAEARTTEGLSGVSKAQVNDYSEKIEALASKLVTPLPDIQILEDLIKRNSFKESPSKTDGETHSPSSPGLSRRFLPASNYEDRTHSTFEADTSEPVKLDAATHIHIEKHRKLQGNLTDEMVGFLTRQRRLLSKAWQALVMPMCGLRRYTQRVLRLHVSRGF
ncbi:Vesicle transport USE1 [Melia azedarach]|uniref:Vesicle transport USE1 n=1 Tax=Melia azedarach TaxID=155640 RepID=A0ACC1XQB6_MELAZ|nr:Vesicle transport USE1 [Melia azedarach]